MSLSVCQCISSELTLVYQLPAAVMLKSFLFFSPLSPAPATNRTMPPVPRPRPLVVSWKVLPAILQKHCCILPDKNTGKNWTEVPVSTEHISHTQCWYRSNEYLIEEKPNYLSTCFCLCCLHLESHLLKPFPIGWYLAQSFRCFLFGHKHVTLSKLILLYCHFSSWAATQKYL